ncbi:hypothetical protein GIB67_014549 [Kingdonia uniflora]|uniref:Uncharacterized protein n=1 Tax=Kingdonia uniflora TaxID=39325 RepID=A0A7J7LKA9_9MAGN|nr:hypothetical protein GIB67_014549 [Kingdonia uniflora]
MNEEKLDKCMEVRAHFREQYDELEERKINYKGLAKAEGVVFEDSSDDEVPQTPDVHGSIKVIEDDVMEVDGARQGKVADVQVPEDGYLYLEFEKNKSSLKGCSISKECEVEYPAIGYCSYKIRMIGFRVISLVADYFELLKFVIAVVEAFTESARPRTSIALLNNTSVTLPISMRSEVFIKVCQGLFRTLLEVKQGVDSDLSLSDMSIIGFEKILQLAKRGDGGILDSFEFSCCESSSRRAIRIVFILAIVARDSVVAVIGWKVMDDDSSLIKPLIPAPSLVKDELPPSTPRRHPSQGFSYPDLPPPTQQCSYAQAVLNGNPPNLDHSDM